MYLPSTTTKSYRLYYILPTIPPFFPPSLRIHVPLPPYFSHLSISLSFSYRLSDIIYVMNHISEFLYYRAFLKVYEILNTTFPFLFIILFKLFMFTNISSYISFINNCFLFQIYFSSLRNIFFFKPSFLSLTFVKFIFCLIYYNPVSSFFVSNFIFLFIFSDFSLFRLIMFRKNMYSDHLCPICAKPIVTIFKHLTFSLSLYTLKSFHILIKNVFIFLCADLNITSL